MKDTELLISGMPSLKKHLPLVVLKIVQETIKI